MENVNMIDCDKHGKQEETFVCQHIVESLYTKTPVGFYSASEPRGDAWCNECERVRIQEGGGWNEKSECLLVSSYYVVPVMMRPKDLMQMPYNKSFKFARKKRGPDAAHKPRSAP